MLKFKTSYGYSSVLQLTENAECTNNLFLLVKFLPFLSHVLHMLNYCHVLLDNICVKFKNSVVTLNRRLHIFCEHFSKKFDDHI